MPIDGDKSFESARPIDDAALGRGSVLDAYLNPQAPDPLWDFDKKIRLPNHAGYLAHADLLAKHGYDLTKPFLTEEDPTRQVTCVMIRLNVSHLSQDVQQWQLGMVRNAIVSHHQRWLQPAIPETDWLKPCCTDRDTGEFMLVTTRPLAEVHEHLSLLLDELRLSTPDASITLLANTHPDVWGFDLESRRQLLRSFNPAATHQQFVEAQHIVPVMPSMIEAPQPTIAELGMRELEEYLSDLKDAAGNPIRLDQPYLSENDPSTKFALGHIKIRLARHEQRHSPSSILQPTGWWARDGQVLSPQDTAKHLHQVVFESIDGLDGCALFCIGDNSATAVLQPPLELEFAIVTCADMDAVRERMYEMHDLIQDATLVPPVISMNSNESRWVQGMDLNARLKVLRNFSNFASQHTAPNEPQVHGMSLKSYRQFIESFPEPEGLTPNQLAVLQREKKLLMRTVDEYISGKRKLDQSTAEVTTEPAASIERDGSNVVRLDVWRNQQTVMNVCNQASDNLRGIQVA